MQAIEAPRKKARGIRSLSMFIKYSKGREEKAERNGKKKTSGPKSHEIQAYPF
jgi:hypothetical protein